MYEPWSPAASLSPPAGLYSSHQSPAGDLCSTLQALWASRMASAHQAVFAEGSVIVCCCKGLHVAPCYKGFHAGPCYRGLHTGPYYRGLHTGLGSPLAHLAKAGARPQLFWGRLVDPHALQQRLGGGATPGGSPQA